MNALIEVEAVNIYGRKMYRPVNEQARALVALMDVRNFVRADLVLAHRMGFHVRLVGTFGDFADTLTEQEKR